MRAAVVTRCDAPPVLEFGEQVLDLVAFLVECLVIWIWHLSASARGDAGLYPLCLQCFPEDLAVISAISNQRLGWRQDIKHEPSALMIAHLTFGKQHDDRAPLTIADGVQFGVQPAFGSPDTTGNIPFFSRLDAVRCAFRCVASIMMRSGLGP